AAGHLFGVQKTHVTLLSSEAGQPGGPPGSRPARKPEFEAAFREIRQKAGPEDIVVVYLSGHGVAYQRGGQSGYAYLTQDAATADVASTVFLPEHAITGDELASWLAGTKAKKQVLILDTCAAG